jgi:hypothetical protein
MCLTFFAFLSSFHKPEMEEKTQPEQSCGNSASLQHMLNEDPDSAEDQLVEPTIRGKILYFLPHKHVF